MNKPSALRAHLLAAVPELHKNPDRLLVFIDNGTIRSTAAPGLSFEYSYTLNVILTDYAGHPDAVAIPLLAWLLVNQPELLTNLEKGKTAIAFEADVLDNSKVDLSLKLPLTERVIVKKQDDGSLQVSHPNEPELFEETFTLEGLRLETPSGEVIAQWGEPTP
ncbi:phage tail protein [Pseudomonas corrugata]|uniref:Phage tail protein n=1 Tax=Pseudomonas corrugata TaxID=47879 RepID=A0A7Y5Z314_9PSED|nr:phage tail protein [Pseudomonas corrugata]NUT85899.1 phage tail protein [Pseudomonas corrugata]